MNIQQKAHLFPSHFQFLSLFFFVKSFLFSLSFMSLFLGQANAKASNEPKVAKYRYYGIGVFVFF